MNIQDARSTQDAVAAGRAGDTMVPFQKVISDAIATSIGNKTNSATISFSGKAGADVMRSLQALKEKGYKVAQSGTDWTITW